MYKIHILFREFTLCTCSFLFTPPRYHPHFVSVEMAADIPVEEAKAQLLAIQKTSPANQKCIECNAPSPTWASPMYGSIPLTTIGVDFSFHLSAVFGSSSLIGSPFEFCEEYYNGQVE
jgi:hypothetical protein